MRRLDGKIAVVTGAASGIGKALTEALVARGTKVVLTDIQEEAGQELTARLKTQGADVWFKPLDVTDAGAFKDVIDEVVRERGRIDLMLNNAGIGIIGEARHLDVSDWDKTFDVNLRGVSNGVAAVYPHMIEQGSGHIHNTSSLSGLVPAPSFVPYCASKYAVVGLSMALRVEAKAFGVEVTVLCPGFVETPLVMDNAIHGVSSEGTKRLVKELPMISPEQCASAAIRGIQRNQAIIVTPFLGKLAWWASRLSPGLSRWFGAQLLQQVRRQQKS